MPKGVFILAVAVRFGTPVPVKILVCGKLALAGGCAGGACMR
jgi:hypothetical protein